VTIVRVGATKKYSTGWETAFGKGKKKTEPAAAAKKAAKPTAAKASTKKKPAKTRKK
jgi:hypothetical protein